MTDRIGLCGIEFRGHHGVGAEERSTGGHYSVDVWIDADLARAGSTDDLSDTVDYGQIFDRVMAVGRGESFRLLEALAERMATEILRLPGIRQVRIQVRKHRPPMDGVVAFAAVELVRPCQACEG